MRPKRTSLSPLNLTRRGVPKAFHECTIEDLDDFGSPERAKVLEFITDYIENLPQKYEQNTGLFMYGSNGVGKSFIASLIVKEAYVYRYTSKRCTFVDYINAYTESWSIKNAEEKEEAIGHFYRNFKAVEFLVLEEIGKEVESKLAPSLLEDLLRFREERGYVTIICSNITPKEVAERYGTSIGSLIKGNFTPITLVGKDKRAEVYKHRVDKEVM